MEKRSGEISDQARNPTDVAGQAPLSTAAEDDRLASVREHIALQNAAIKAQRRRYECDTRALKAEIAMLKAELGSHREGSLRNKVERWRASLRFRRDAREVRRSGLFDAAWYKARYGDVARSAMEPVEHYLRYGAAEGRDPNPDFAAGWYKRTYLSDAAGTNPLLDYIRNGAKLGRDPSPHFRSAWYRTEYPDVAASALDPLVHYQRFGRREGRLTAPGGP